VNADVIRFSTRSTPAHRPAMETWNGARQIVTTRCCFDIAKERRPTRCSSPSRSLIQCDNRPRVRRPAVTQAAERRADRGGPEIPYPSNNNAVNGSNVLSATAVWLRHCTASATIPLPRYRWRYSIQHSIHTGCRPTNDTAIETETGREKLSSRVVVLTSQENAD